LPLCSVKNMLPYIFSVQVLAMKTASVLGSLINSKQVPVFIGIRYLTVTAYFLSMVFISIFF
jgi:hypothetical protein